jgi:phospholipase D1/2
MISQPAPMLDPSTNANCLSGDPEHPTESQPLDDKKGKKRSTDVSKHTFYIVNAQMRLKLFARNEVRQNCLKYGGI